MHQEFCCVRFSLKQNLNSSRPRSSAASWKLAAFVLLAGLCADLRAQTSITFDTFSSFRGTNGASPRAALARATNSVFYGVTARGGDFDQGTVFSATTSGT